MGYVFVRHSLRIQIATRKAQLFAKRTQRLARKEGRLAGVLESATCWVRLRALLGDGSGEGYRADFIV